MKFYLGGQSNFGNRGCEALVRGIAHLIHERMPDARLMCPLDDIDRDGRQWPEAAANGVDFVPSTPFPAALRWWGRFNRILPLESAGVPSFPLPTEIAQQLRDVSALIMTGGDNLTLDYGVPSLYFWCGINEKAMDMGIPVFLWGASVGPFTAKPAVEKVMARHLRRYAGITVRETITLNYLQGLGLEKVELVADPAFHLRPESFEASALIDTDERPLLGFNVSPLIRKFRQGASDANQMDADILAFLRHVIDSTEFSILLVPHVDPLDGSPKNSDWYYMRGLYAQLVDIHDRIRLAPPTLNAAQLKYIIGRCRYFIGARTHSTIAALSQGVPTLSIAYSTKAKGLNQDLFGHQRYVLDTPLVSAQSLAEGLTTLRNEEGEIRGVLQERLPEWRTRAVWAVDGLLSVVNSKHKALES
jgi:colanic acid/amylovoran biosynthesis protein